MPNMHTSVEITSQILEVPAPSRVRVPLESCHKSLVKKKQLVGKGQVIAENPAKGPHGRGYVHATIDGAVEEVTKTAIVIGPAPAPKEGEEPPTFEHPAPNAELESLRGEELCRAFLEMGIDTGAFRPSRTLVINGLNPEPGVVVSEQLLMGAKETLELGLRMLEFAIRPGKVYLVIANGLEAVLHGCEVIHSTDVYPFTIDPLVMLRATGAEHPDGVDAISVSDLYRVGMVCQTKQPLLDAILSVGDNVFRTVTGTPVHEVLEAADQPHGKGWQVALDGPMRGTAISDLNVGVPENCTAITVVQDGTYPPVAQNPCINCGECVLICPARIQPGMLSKYVEFDMIEETRLQHIAACLECGMCSYVCPANRPMLQYMRLAKEVLGAQDDYVATCRLPE